MTRNCIDCQAPSEGVRCEPCYEAQPVTPEGFTIAQLRRTFDDVATPDDWKAAICCAITVGERELAARAIEFFTGSVATFTELREQGCLQVQASGYRAAQGS